MVIVPCSDDKIPLVSSFKEKPDTSTAEEYIKQGALWNAGVFAYKLSLEFAVITGCLRVAKESIFTGTNNFASYSVIDDDFFEYFGFSQTEINELLKVAGLEKKSDIIKDWYDGYVFGNHYVYCPWDVINYLSALRKNENAQPKNYWNNTSHNGVLLTFIEAKNLRVKGKFEKLLNGKTITQTISDQITYNTKNNTEDNFWSILLMTGYLTKANPDETGDNITLKIPNKEISIIFEQTVVQYFIKNKDLTLQNTLIKAFFNRDENTATQAISNLLWKTISYNNYHENYYHAFLTALL